MVGAGSVCTHAQHHGCGVCSLVRLVNHISCVFSLHPSSFRGKVNCLITQLDHGIETENVLTVTVQLIGTHRLNLVNSSAQKFGSLQTYIQIDRKKKSRGNRVGLAQVGPNLSWLLKFLSENLVWKTFPDLFTCDSSNLKVVCMTGRHCSILHSN